MKRSFLMVPATKFHRFWTHLSSNAATLPDCVVLDLEDSVPPHRKADVSEELAVALRERRNQIDRRVSLILKIDNPRRVGHFHDEIEKIFPEISLFDYIKIGKVDDVEQIECVRRLSADQGVGVLPTIETAAGFCRRDEIVDWCYHHKYPFVSYGAGDMSLSLLVERDYDLYVLKHIFSSLVVSCAMHGLTLVDSPSRITPGSGHDWAERVRCECDWAFANGAKAKTAIHPAQVPIIHDVWAQRYDEERVTRVIQLFAEEPDHRALRDRQTGEYIGTPVLKHAQRVAKLLKDQDT